HDELRTPYVGGGRDPRMLDGNRAERARRPCRAWPGKADDEDGNGQREQSQEHGREAHADRVGSPSPVPVQPWFSAGVSAARPLCGRREASQTRVESSPHSMLTLAELLPHGPTRVEPADLP